MVNWIEAIPECPVCLISFVKLTPMVLPDCGHTICEGCVKQIISDSTQTQPKCPTCKVRFQNAKKNFMLLQWIQNLDPEVLSKQQLAPKPFKFPASLNVSRSLIDTANTNLLEPMQKIKDQQEKMSKVEAQVEKIQKTFDQEAAKIKDQFKRLKLNFNRIIQSVLIEKVQKMSLKEQVRRIKQLLIEQQFKVSKNKNKFKSHLNSLHKLDDQELIVLANQGYVPAQVIQEVGDFQQIWNELQRDMGFRLDNSKLKQLEKSDSVELLKETITSICDFQPDTGTSKVLQRFEELIREITFKVKINPVKIEGPQRQRELKGIEKFQQALAKCSVQQLGFPHSPRIQCPENSEEDSIQIQVNLNSQEEVQICTGVKRKFQTASKQDSRILFPNERSASKSLNQTPEKSQKSLRSVKNLRNTLGTPVRSFKESSYRSSVWCHNEFIFFTLSEQQLIFNLSELKITSRPFKIINSIQIIRPNTRQSIIQANMNACQVSSNRWFATGASPSENCYSLKSEQNEFTLKRLNLTCKPRTGHRLMYINDHVFCIGGNVSGKPSRFVEKLRLGTEHYLWKNCQQVPKPTSNFGLTQLNDTCMLLVGSGPSNCLFASVYDTNADTWSLTVDLQQPSLNVQSIWTHQISSDRTLILITPKSNNRYAVVNDYTRDPTQVLIMKLGQDFQPQNILQFVCHLKENRELSSNAVVVDNKLFVFGGNLRNTCETIDDIEGTNPRSCYITFKGAKIKSPLTSLVGIFKDQEDSVN